MKDLLDLVFIVIAIGTIIYGPVEFYKKVQTETVIKVGRGLPSLEKISDRLILEERKTKAEREKKRP